MKALPWEKNWLPKQSNWNEAIENVVQVLRSGGFEVRERPCAFSTVRLPGDFDEFMSGIPAKRRQQLRRMSRKILGAPGVEIRRVENEQELTAALDALFSLHEKRWNLVGQEGAFNKRPSKRTFYERFAPVALQNGWLGMYELLDNGVPKAVQFGYVYNNVLLQLQEGFDPDYQSNVGNVLRGYVIEDCIANRITEYDFLAGTSEHKRRWCSEIRIGSDVLIVRKTIKNLPLTAVKLWPTGAYLSSCSVTGVSRCHVETISVFGKLSVVC